MKILYTNKGVEVYVDDDTAEFLKGKTIYHNRSSVGIYEMSKYIPLQKLAIDNIKEGSIIKRKDTTKLDFQRTNLDIIAKNIKPNKSVGKADSKYCGVVINKGYSKNYAVPYYYKEGKKISLGYYFTLEDAAIVREYTIRRYNIDTTPTNISITDKELEEKYKEVVDRTRKIKSENKQKSLLALKEYISKKPISNRYGIHLKNNRYVPFVQNNEVKLSLKSYETLTEAAIVRNCHIIKNNIKIPLTPLDIPLEEQLRIRDSIKSISEKTIRKRSVRKSANKYRGLSKQKRGNKILYSVTTSINRKRIYIGSSNNIDLAAMMYNVYVIENNIAKEIINDVGMGIEEQKETLERNGYIFINSRYHRNPGDSRYINKLHTKKEPSKGLGGKKCNINGCNNKHFGKGYCNKHYQQVRKNGKISTDNEEIKKCSVSGCVRKNQSKGYCNRHYQQVSMNGKITHVEEPKKYKLCTVKNCGRPHCAMGYCTKHYAQIYRTGKILEKE